MSSVHHKIIKHKIGLLNLAAELGNVSRACKVMGFSRDTFYRYQAAVETGGVEALIDANRRKPNIKNRVEEATEAAILAFALEQPAFGQVRVSNELRKRGIFVSPSGVRSVWLRQNLESFKKRLSALEKHIAETGAVLTEAQVQALEWKMMLLKAKLRRLTPGISVVRIPFTSVPSKVWDEFTSKPSSTLIPSGQQRSCIPTKHQLHQLICSMTGYCRSLLNRVWALFAF